MVDIAFFAVLPWRSGAAEQCDGMQGFDNVGLLDIGAGFKVIKNLSETIFRTKKRKRCGA
jgi:hypothetical protein